MTKIELNKENYFSNEMSKKYISMSQIKLFIDCEAKALATINGEWKDELKPKAFLQGSMFHSYFEGKEAFDTFISENESLIFKKNGTRYSEFELVQNIIDFLESKKNTIHSSFFKLINLSQPEVIITSKIEGMPCKIMIDRYAPDKRFFSDLKLMKDLYDKFWDKDSREYINFIKHYRYQWQMVFYAEVERLYSKRDKPLSPYLMVVTKKEVPDVAIVTFRELFEDDNKLYNEILDKIKEKIIRIDKLKKGEENPINCGKCNYCLSNQSTKILKYNFEI